MRRINAGCGCSLAVATYTLKFITPLCAHDHEEMALRVVYKKTSIKGKFVTDPFGFISPRDIFLGKLMAIINKS